MVIINALNRSKVMRDTQAVIYINFNPSLHRPE